MTVLFLKLTILNIKNIEVFFCHIGIMYYLIFISSEAK